MVARSTPFVPLSSHQVSGIEWRALARSPWSLVVCPSRWLNGCPPVAVFLSVAPDSIPSCPGSSLVKIGATSVVCAIKLEIGKPLDTKPQDGRLGQGQGSAHVRESSLRLVAACESGLSWAQLAQVDQAR